MIERLKLRFRRLHSQLGDFWWYSLMVFAAARAGDMLNVFVGLYLVPKYIAPSELGAVQPLMNFANFLAVPAAAFAQTFRQELTGLAVKREFGAMKSLMRGVFIATAAFFFTAILVARWLLPHFLTRIRIAEGSLGLLILVASFLNTVSPIYVGNTMQSLKKFRQFSLIQIISAPVRLLTMLATMPFRALSGYFAGQSSVPAFSIFAALFCLRRELAIKAEPYWRSGILRRLLRLFVVFLVSGLVYGAVSMGEMMILRQRLPETDSAAYYMVTRFAEIATFLYGALAFTIFPFTAELAANGKSTLPLVMKAIGVTIVANALLAAFFALFGHVILAFLPHGNRYAEYWWAIPWLIGITCMTQIASFYTNTEISANRFRFLRWILPLHLFYIAMMLGVTGHGYFSAWLPKSCTEFLNSHNIFDLRSILLWFTVFNAVKMFACLLALFHDLRRGSAEC